MRPETGKSLRDTIMASRLSTVLYLNSSGQHSPQQGFGARVREVERDYIPYLLLGNPVIGMSCLVFRHCRVLVPEVPRFDEYDVGYSDWYGTFRMERISNCCPKIHVRFPIVLSCRTWAIMIVTAQM